MTSPSSMRFARRALGGLAVGLLAALLLVGCGDSDDSESSEATMEATSAVDGSPAATSESTAETTATAASEATPPAEDSGTLTIDGQAWELAAADFGICETVNPAFANEVNVVANIPESDETLRVSGSLEEMDDEFNGFFIRSGDLSQEERGEDLEIMRDGRVLSGSATFERGVVAFSFSC